MHNIFFSEACIFRRSEENKKNYFLLLLKVILTVDQETTLTHLIRGVMNNFISLASIFIPKF